jgi:hypothetical protein
MRVLYVWFTAIVAILIITLGWYLGNAIVITIAHEALSDATGSAFSLVTLIEYVAAWWGPILDCVVLLWAFMNSREYGTNYV